jgi:cell division protein FtsQ
MADEKYYKRRRRGAIIYTPIAALLIIVIVIFGVSVFFRTSEIEVQGAKKYTAEQIVAASGIKKGDNLVFIDSSRSEESIKTNLPYLNDVRIDKVVPDKIEIIVTESLPIAVVTVNGARWILDQKARVLEEADENSVQGKIAVNGLSPTKATISRLLAVGDDDKTKLLYLANVLSAVQSAGIAGDIASVDVSNIGSIKFGYKDRFTVILGNGEDVDYKLVKLHDVLEQLQPDDKGKIDLSEDNTARFIPDK